MTDLPALESVRFTCFGPPRPKERPRLGKGGRVYTPERTQQYERAIAQQGALWCGPAWPRHGIYRVTLRFVFNREPRCDVDNCAKAVLDALNGIAWDDDKQVTELRCSKAVDANQITITSLAHGPCDVPRGRTEVLIERIGEWKKPKRFRRGKSASFDEIIAREDERRGRSASVEGAQRWSWWPAWRGAWFGGRGYEGLLHHLLPAAKQAWLHRGQMRCGAWDGDERRQGARHHHLRQQARRVLLRRRHEDSREFA